MNQESEWWPRCGLFFQSVIIWMKLRLKQGNKKHQKLKKKRKGKVEGSKEIDTYPSIYINPVLPAPDFPASSAESWGSRAPHGKFLFHDEDAASPLQGELMKQIESLWKVWRNQTQLIKKSCSYELNFLTYRTRVCGLDQYEKISACNLIRRTLFSTKLNLSSYFAPTFTPHNPQFYIFYKK